MELEVGVQRKNLTSNPQGMLVIVAQGFTTKAEKLPEGTSLRLSGLAQCADWSKPPALVFTYDYAINLFRDFIPIPFTGLCARKTAQGERKGKCKGACNNVQGAHKPLQEAYPTTHLKKSRDNLIQVGRMTAIPG